MTEERVRQIVQEEIAKALRAAEVDGPRLRRSVIVSLDVEGMAASARRSHVAMDRGHRDLA